MTELDLSFVTTKAEAKAAPAPEKAGNLDLSFVAKKGEVEIPKQKSTLSKIGDLFTGNDRIPESSKELGEVTIPASLFLKNPKAAFKVMIGMATTFDDERLANVLRENLPQLKFSQDEKGNTVVDATAIGGDVGFLNKPGISLQDVATIAAQFSPFSKASQAKAGAGILSNAVRVGGKTAATQAGLDLTNQAVGGTDEVSLANVDKGDVAIAGGGGALFQSLFQSLGKVIPVLREQVKSHGVTEDVRKTITEHAVKLGMKPEDVTDDVITSFLQRADSAVTPDEALALAGEREFGIPLTAAQRSLDDAALSAEDRLRAGTSSEKAQRVIRGFEKDQQMPAINQARQNIEQSLGGEPLSRRQAGEVVTQGVREAESAASKTVSDAYASVGDAALEPESINRLFNATRKAVIGADKDRGLKSTASLLDQINRSQKVMVELQKAGAKLKPKHINEIELLRRRVNTAIGSAENATDKAQVVGIKRALDDFLDDAVANALFTGDDQALSALKSARGLFADYARKFRAQPKRTRGGTSVPDPAGRFIERIVESDPTGEQVMNALLGANNLSNKAGAQMAARFRDILGKDSEGWQAIRQEAFRRLIKTNKVNGEDIISGQQTLKAISKAMDENESLMTTLFTPQELGTFRRFAAHVKRTQPDLVRSRENPSGTAQAASKALGDVVQRIGTALSLGGEPALIVTSSGVKAAKGFSDASKAKRAVRPFSEAFRVRRGLVGGSVTGSQSVAE